MRIDVESGGVEILIHYKEGHEKYPWFIMFLTENTSYELPECDKYELKSVESDTKFTITGTNDE
jgi:hypothetical protein